MALPTYVGAGTGAGSVAAITPALPASLATDDILLFLIETANEAVTIADDAGGTWAEVTNSPQGVGTAADVAATRLTVFWSRYNGTQTAPTTSDAGNHQIGMIFAFRGCETTGDPWNVTSGNTDAVDDDSLSATGATTTVDDCLVCICAALNDDIMTFDATWTNGDLANITFRSGIGNSAGNDGRIGLATGEKATAGAYGATTNTLTSAAAGKGMMTIALKPPGGGEPPATGWGKRLGMERFRRVRAA